MSVCLYCGQKAGWFSNVHSECAQKANQNIATLKKCVVDAIVQAKKYDDVKQEVNDLKSGIPQDQFLTAFKEAWSEGAEKRSTAHPISDPEFTDIADFYRGAGITADSARHTSGHFAMLFSFLIWTVLNNEIDPYDGPVKFNLGADEIPVFGIANVLLSEQRTASSYVGGYSGVSVRISNGVYYRLGGMRGHKVEHTSLTEMDYGDFLITTKAVYFGGREHSVNFKLPHKHVVRFNPYADAVGICKDGAREKLFAPQTVPNTGWFLFNILQALAARDA